MKKRWRGIAVAAWATAVFSGWAGLVPDAEAGFNEDGKADVVFANEGSNTVCLGDGRGGFDCSPISADAFSSRAVAVAYIDQDQHLDVIFANFAARNRVCLGDGAGGFTCSDVSTDANATTSLVVSGVGIGVISDVVFGNFGEPNRLCLGDGLGGFACSDISTDAFKTNGVAFNLVLVTFIKQWRTAVVFANEDEANRVCLIFGVDYTYTCQNAGDNANTTRGVAGRTGLLSPRHPFPPTRLVVFSNDGQANQLCHPSGGCIPVSADTRQSVGAPGLGDLDGNGTPDIVFANRNETNRVCLADGFDGMQTEPAGSITCADVSSDATFTTGVALVALRQDLKRPVTLDAVFSEQNRNRVCFGDGAGGFTSCSDVSNDVGFSNGVAAAPALGSPWFCRGEAVTIVGTDGPDTIAGTNGNDVIDALGGNDTVDARGGKDVVCLGPGNDTGDGGSGNDFLFGGSGNDRISGGPGKDFLFGGSESDRIRGGPGKDSLFGEFGDDSLKGARGNDRLFGGSDNDVLRGSRGNDEMVGGFGNDRLLGEKGNDLLIGGSGNDLLLGSSGNDRLLGEEGNDLLIGGSGNDELKGGSGKDELKGGRGRDRLRGNDGNDFLNGGPGADTGSGGPGTDRCKRVVATKCEK